MRRFPFHLLCAPEGDTPSGAAASAPTASPAPDSLPDSALPSSDGSTPVSGSSPGDGVDKLAAPHLAAYDGFDPAIHKVDENGVPVKTPTGRYAKKPKANSGIASPASAVVNAKQTANVGATVKVDHLPVAKQIVNIGVNCAVRFLGDEWKPVDKDELPPLAFAFRDYFDARGVPQMPPEVVLLMAIGAYAAPRLNHENTQSKLRRMFSRIQDWRDRFTKKKAK